MLKPDELLEDFAISFHVLGVGSGCSKMDLQGLQLFQIKKKLEEVDKKVN